MDLSLDLKDVGRERARLRVSISWKRSVFLSRGGLPIMVWDRLIGGERRNYDALC